MDITYNGPDAWFGKIGHFLIILAFISAIVSAVSYWISTFQAKKNASSSFSWKQVGKTTFFFHLISVISIVSLLFYMLATKRYVYSYVYSHASNDLPFRYLFAAFWEGQEGSTMLWMFWHVILGAILIFKARKWEAPVVGTIALVQVFLTSMLLGIYFFEYRLGVNPFTLLRSSAANAPIFQTNPNFIPKDGKGLNELLRNYWMVIHPPIVFLGFASITVPFGYVLGALTWRDLKDWISPALPWALLAGGVLGIGILMGGAWAYESLSFGGFWTWDPVENASLVPWLLIVSAIHLMLVYRSTGYSGLATVVLVILSFLLVAYSTFLTKSGVLGESSVHSFTDLGMSGQLVVFILFFWFFAFLLLQSNLKLRLFYTAGSALILLLYFVLGQAGYLIIAFLLFSFATLFAVYDFKQRDVEEKLWSREFWMFVGSLVVFLSALHIILATSLPVYNKLFDTELKINDVEPHFNSIQIWPAIIMALLSAVVLYFRYTKDPKKGALKPILIPLILAILSTIGFVVLYKFKNWIYITLLFTSIFSVLANFSYMASVVKMNVRLSGASVAHIGFAMLLLGVVISQSKKTLVSANMFAKVNSGGSGDDEIDRENVLLYEGEPTQMRNYLVTMRNNVEEGKLRDRIVVDFDEYDEEMRFQDMKSLGDEFISQLNIKNKFQLKPTFKVMGNESIVGDPSIKRGLFQDFFTNLSLINLGTDVDSTKFEPISFKPKNDTIPYDRMLFVLKGMKQETTRTDIDVKEGNVTIVADMDVITKDSLYSIEPVYLIEGNQVKLYPADIPEEKISVQLSDIRPLKEEIEIGIRSAKPFKKFIMLRAIIFPLINLVWLGSILMFIGFILSMIERFGQSNKFA